MSDLIATDEALVRAYQAVGVPVDALPYTHEMEQLVVRLGQSVTTPNLCNAYHRLATLKRAGRLPRIYKERQR